MRLRGTTALIDLFTVGGLAQGAPTAGLGYQAVFDGLKGLAREWHAAVAHKSHVVIRVNVRRTPPRASSRCPASRCDSS